MEERIPISVVLCTYNGSRFIKESIDSILAQTFTNFEFIIWDDGSTDKTREIVESYHDNRIKYYYHENTGLGVALNLACQKAKGKYIARMDDDDISFPERLEKEYKYMEKHPQCVLLSTGMYYIDEKGVVKNCSFPYTWNRCLQKALKLGNPFTHPACMFRSDIYNKTLGYPGTRSMQDRIMFNRIARLGKVYNIGEPLLYYRLSDTSIGHSIVEYKPALISFAKIIADSEDYRPEDEMLFNEMYRIAKKNSIKQTTGFYKDSWFNIYKTLSCILPISWSRQIVLFTHNVFGLLRL